MEALTATTRVSRGKGSNRRLRAAGQLPAIVYGLDTEAVALSVDPAVLRRILMGAKRRNTLIGLSIDGGTPSLFWSERFKPMPSRKRDPSHRLYSSRREGTCGCESSGGHDG